MSTAPASTGSLAQPLNIDLIQLIQRKDCLLSSAIALNPLMDGRWVAGVSIAQQHPMALEVKAAFDHLIVLVKDTQHCIDLCIANITRGGK